MKLVYSVDQDTFNYNKIQQSDEDMNYNLRLFDHFNERDRKTVLWIPNIVGMLLYDANRIKE